MTACVPVIPDNFQGNPTLQTPDLAPLPSAVVTTTLTSTVTIEITSTTTLLPTSRFTPIPSFTSTVHYGVEDSSTVTNLPIYFTETPIPDTDTPVSGTTTPIESVSLGKLPPNPIYKPVHIQNGSGKQVDITLDCTTNKGRQIILEYNNVKNLFTDIPEGNYVYVIFVGGRQLTGGFSFMTAPKLFITIYQERVAVH
jgi:hypothetical protein